MDCLKPVTKAVQDVTKAVTDAVGKVIVGGKRRTHTRSSKKSRKSKKSHHKSKKSRVSKRSRRGGADEKPPFKLNPIEQSLQKFLDKRIERKNKANAQKKGGGIISTAMVPFGLLGLQRLLKSRKSNKHHKRSKSAHRTRRR